MSSSEARARSASRPAPREDDHPRSEHAQGRPKDTQAAGKPSSADLSSPTGRRTRKEQVLTRGSASVVRSITDAVVAKNGEPFFLCRPDGSVPLDEAHGFGFYHHDTRYLSGYDLRIEGERMTGLAASAASGMTAVLELTNPEIRTGDGTIPKERLDLRLSRTVDGPAATLRDRLEIKNLGLDAVAFRVVISLRADFRDVFAIRGLLDERPGELVPPRWHDGALVFAYHGKDGVERTLRATFDPACDATGDREASFDLRLDGRASATIALDLSIEEKVREGDPAERGAGGRSPSDTRGPATSIEPGEWIGDGDWRTTVRTDSLVLDQVLARSLGDLTTLRSSLRGHRFYEAGIPWFATLFGRDSLIACLQTLAFDTDTAADTLRLLASAQGSRDDEWRDEAPGKILHELRVGELARLHEIPHTPYYGSIDSTPLFLVLLARHAAWTGSTDLFTALRDEVERALGWIDRTEAAFGGYLAYRSTTEHGLVNQGWKDSGDAIVRADGTLADPPIALPEVQGYVYMARMEIAELYDRTGDAQRASDLRSAAADLRERFERDFWSDRLGCYVLALEDGGRQCEVVASNAGQVLWSGIASADRAKSVAERLLADDVFNGWGIRTLAASERAYRPIGYHLGTVWPHDNGIIAAGFRRYGLGPAAERLFAALMETAVDFAHQRLPECFAGYDRADYGAPVRYPVACHPQAWAAGSIPHLLGSSLGLIPEGLDGRLRVVRPDLPSFVAQVELRGLTVGPGSADLRFSRASDGTTEVEVVGVHGGLDVVVEADGEEPSQVGEHASDERRATAGTER